MTDWISHNVGGCPVGHHVNVIVKYGSGERTTGKAGSFDWTIAGGKAGAVVDIVEYQIVDAGSASTDWIEWNGGECPVGSLARVEVRFRNLRQECAIACQYDWSHSDDRRDIVAYRLVDAPRASTDSALSHQPCGTHYSDAEIQPVQFIEANNLGFLEGCIVKRATRHSHPTGKGAEDIRKIIHEAQLLLELRYGEVA